jgi:hypothetical protein
LRSTDVHATLLLLTLAGAVNAQPAPQPLPVLDVPFISQTEALCGGAAAAMVLRYWGERGLAAEDFAHLVDRSAAGIRTLALVGELRRRGWNAQGIAGSDETLGQELAAGRPVIALIEDRPGTFHYVVLVAATERAVVFHDPARTPFRVASTAEFGRRWRAADRWMAVITPRDDAPIEPPEPAAAPTNSTPCEQLVAEGVRAAQSGDLETAERRLAAAIACPGPAPLRELAGVRVLQRRWQDAADLAAAVVATAPDDAYAWRVLATSRFLQNDPASALDAWNRVGEPRVDLLRVSGLTHTRQRAVERLVAVPVGSVLAAPSLARASRRLSELPSAMSTRLEYVPVTGGLAELRANVFERPLVPVSRLELLGLGVTAAARREIAVPFASLGGGGELITARWRFWQHRPLYGGAISAPAPWGGVWGVDASFSEQPFDAAIPPARRTSVVLLAEDWATSRLRWTVRGGADRWDAAFARVGASTRLEVLDDRLELRGDADAWVGSDSFTTARAEVAGRTSRERHGIVFTGRAGHGVATAAAAADLWFFGDTGHASPILLRAHRALEDGRLRTSQLGRTATYATVEAQHWWRARWSLGIGAAVFADTVRIAHRFDGGARLDTDVGAGLRFSIPGLAGVLRLDAADGLRDRARALSVVYAPW